MPGWKGLVWVTAADYRLFVEALLYRCRTGMPWLDLPERSFCGFSPIALTRSGTRSRRKGPASGPTITTSGYLTLPYPAGRWRTTGAVG
jgi:hypothetical protein